MKNSNIFLYFLYFFSLLVSLNFSSLFLFWVALEINMLVFILLLVHSAHKVFKSDLMGQIFFYFLVQSLGSILLLISFLFSQTSSNMFIMDFIFVLSICLKSALFPFHYWMFKLGPFIPNFSLFLVLTLQKLPLMFALFNVNSKLIFFLMIINMLVGNFLLEKSITLKELLFSTSVYGLIWFYLTFNMNFITFVLILLIYSLNIYILLNFNNSPFLENFSENKSKLFLTSMMFFLGLPPFSIFFMKLFIFQQLSMSFTYSTVLMLFIFGFIPIYIYFRFLFIKSFSHENFYVNFSSVSLFHAVSVFSSLLLFFF